MTTLDYQPTSRGHILDLSPSAFGKVRPSDDLLGHPEALRQRLDRDGYLYVPGFFERDEIMGVRASFTTRLAEEGLLNPDYPAIEAVASREHKDNFRSDMAQNNPVLKKVVFGKQLLGFYEMIFGEAVRHFDFIWLRAIGAGQGTQPHCDLVYMGRGTHDLLTCWIPYGNVSLDLGGLMVLEESHRKSD